MTKKKILIATGGTGGHIFPALSLAKTLIKKNYDIILTTDKRGFKYLCDLNEINLKMGLKFNRKLEFLSL